MKSPSFRRPGESCLFFAFIASLVCCQKGSAPHPQEDNVVDINTETNDLGNNGEETGGGGGELEGDEWEELAQSASGGGISKTEGLSENIDIQIDLQGKIHLAWHDKWQPDLRRQVFYAFWDGSQWKGLGNSTKLGGLSSAFSAFNGASPSLAIDSNGNPHVAWAGTPDQNSGGKIYYVSWDGSTWVGLGGSESGRISAIRDNSVPVLVLDYQDRPHIAWAGKDSNSDVYYVYWDGAAWSPLGASASGRGVSLPIWGAGGPSLAIDSQGHPHIAFSGKFADGENEHIYYTYWNGSAWTGMAKSYEDHGINPAAFDSGGPSLALKNDIPYVAFAQKNANGEKPNVFLRFLDNNSWSALDAGEGKRGISDISTGAYFPKLVLDSQKQLHLAYFAHLSADVTRDQSRVIYKYWSGSSWLALGSGQFGKLMTIFAYRPALATDSSNSPAVAWPEMLGENQEVYFRIWR